MEIAKNIQNVIDQDTSKAISYFIHSFPEQVGCKAHL